MSNNESAAAASLPTTPGGEPANKRQRRTNATVEDPSLNSNEEPPSPVTPGTRTIAPAPIFLENGATHRFVTRWNESAPPNSIQDVAHAATGVALLHKDPKEFLQEFCDQGYYQDPPNPGFLLLNCNNCLQLAHGAKVVPINDVALQPRTGGAKNDAFVSWKQDLILFSGDPSGRGIPVVLASEGSSLDSILGSTSVRLCEMKAIKDGNNHHLPTLPPSRSRGPQDVVRVLPIPISWAACLIEHRFQEQPILAIAKLIEITTKVSNIGSEWHPPCTTNISAETAVAMVGDTLRALITSRDADNPNPMLNTTLTLHWDGPNSSVNGWLRRWANECGLAPAVPPRTPATVPNQIAWNQADWFNGFLGMPNMQHQPPLPPQFGVPPLHGPSTLGHGAALPNQTAQTLGTQQAPTAPPMGNMQLQPAQTTGTLQAQTAQTTGTLQHQPAQTTGNLQHQPAQTTGNTQAQTAQTTGNPQAQTARTTGNTQAQTAQTTGNTTNPTGTTAGLGGNPPAGAPGMNNIPAGFPPQPPMHQAMPPWMQMMHWQMMMQQQQQLHTSQMMQQSHQFMQDLQAQQIVDRMATPTESAPKSKSYDHNLIAYFRNETSFDSLAAASPEWKATFLHQFLSAPSLMAAKSLARREMARLQTKEPYFFGTFTWPDTTWEQLFKMEAFDISINPSSEWHGKLGYALTFPYKKSTLQQHRDATEQSELFKENLSMSLGDIKKLILKPPPLPNCYEAMRQATHRYLIVLREWFTDDCLLHQWLQTFEQLIHAEVSLDADEAAWFTQWGPHLMWTIHCEAARFFNSNEEKPYSPSNHSQALAKIHPHRNLPLPFQVMIGQGSKPEPQGDRSGSSKEGLGKPPPKRSNLKPNPAGELVNHKFHPKLKAMWSNIPPASARMGPLFRAAETSLDEVAKLLGLDPQKDCIMFHVRGLCTRRGCKDSGTAHDDSKQFAQNQVDQVLAKLAKGVKKLS